MSENLRGDILTHTVQHFETNICTCRWKKWCRPLYTVSGKRVYSILGITSSDTSRFSKFFHFQNLLEICSKAVITYSTTPKTRHYTTLWNIDVRKLACPVRCGSIAERQTRQNPYVLQANESCILQHLLLTYCINFDIVCNYYPTIILYKL